MTDVPFRRSLVQLEETQFRTAVSESLAQKLGGNQNFIIERQYDTKMFFANGQYSATGINEVAFDGLYVCPFDIEIFNASMYNIVAGSSGQTEIDVLVSASGSMIWTSIFSTPPAIAASGGNFASVIVGQTGTGLTAPILITPVVSLNAGDRIRSDFLDKQLGTPENCGVLVYTRPR